MFITFFAAKVEVYNLTGSKKEFEIKHYSLVELIDSMDAIKGTVCLNKDYKPWEVDRLELHHENYNGLFFWHNEIIKEIANSNKELKK